MKTVFAYIVTKNYKHITAYNSHDFKNNQEEKICRKVEQICLFILLSKDN